MAKISFSIGERFGLWTVLALPEDRKVLCVCDCGKKHPVNQYNLYSGKSTMCLSCSMKNKVTKHGLSGTDEYKTWKSMKARCYKPSHKNYAEYGGRGIKVCDEWLNSPEVFISDMGKKPSQLHSIERIDVNGHYCKENCKWASQSDQMNNTRRSLIVTHNGITMTVAEWSRLTGIKDSTIYHRLAAGWSIDKAIDTPARKIVPSK